jgi:hypothetical protein
MHCRQTFVTAILCELLLIGARFFFTGHLGPGPLPEPFSVKRADRDFVPWRFSDAGRISAWKGS